MLGVCPRIESCRVAKIFGVTRGDDRAVAKRHCIQQTVPQRLWFPLYLGRMSQSTPRARRFRIPIQYQRTMRAKKFIKPRVDFSFSRCARSCLGSFLNFSNDWSRQKPFGAFHPEQDGLGRLRFPKLRKDIVVQQERLHLRFGICTGPMERNDCNAALRSIFDTGTISAHGSPRSVKVSLRPP